MTVELDLVQESWQELRKYINTMDRSDAADGLVSVLIDNNYDAEQIRSAFKNDSDIKRALHSYLADTEEEDANEDEEDDYDDQY